MYITTKYLDILTYSESDRGIFDLWTNNSKYYPRNRVKTSTINKYPYSGYEETVLTVELVLFRKVIKIYLRYNISYIGVEEAKKRRQALFTTKDYE